MDPTGSKYSEAKRVLLKVFENSRAGYPRIPVVLQIYWAIVIIYLERTTAIWYHFVYRGWTLWQVAKHLKKQNRQICLTSFQARHRLETIAHPKTPQSRIIYPDILSGWITLNYNIFLNMSSTWTGCVNVWPLPVTTARHGPIGARQRRTGAAFAAHKLQ